MKIKLFQVDAFTDKLFTGNPAAVCILDDWLDNDLMQKIAMENNLSETAFVVQKKNQFQIRWFTPLDEVELCGHATLAAAHVIFNYYDYKLDFTGKMDIKSKAMDIGESYGAMMQDQSI